LSTPKEDIGWPLVQLEQIALEEENDEDYTESESSCESDSSFETSCSEQEESDDEEEEETSLPTTEGRNCLTNQPMLTSLYSNAINENDLGEANTKTSSPSSRKPMIEELN
jgi:hypothetical protein